MSRLRDTRRDKGAGAGPVLAARLLALGVDLVFEPHCYYVRRNQETIAYNVAAGMDYPTWELCCHMGATHVRRTWQGHTLTVAVIITSPCTVRALLRAKRWTLEWPESYVLHIWPADDPPAPPSSTDTDGSHKVPPGEAGANAHQMVQ